MIFGLVLQFSTAVQAFSKLFENRTTAHSACQISIAATLFLYVAMFFATSFIEEEHEFFFFAAASTLILLALK